MSWASKRLGFLAALGFLAGACHIRLAEPLHDSMPLGDWKVVKILHDSGRALKRTPATALSQLGRHYFFGPDYIRYPEGIGDLQCVHPGYGLFWRWIDQEELFDPGHSPAFDPREAGIHDRRIYEIKVVCWPGFYLSQDKSCILIFRDGVLQVLKREAGPLKRDPTATPTPEPQPTPRPAVTPLDFHRSEEPRE